MKRRTFLQFLGLASASPAAVVAAPAITRLEPSPDAPFTGISGGRFYVNGHHEWVVDELRPARVFTSEEVYRWSEQKWELL